MALVFDTPRSPLARAVVQYLAEAQSYPYAKLTRVSQVGFLDRLDIDLELELQQRRKVPVQPVEPISILFWADNDQYQPRVRSEREDFPVGMVHTNLDPDWDGGLCLCIWEESWADLATGLTGQALIERIRAWFSSTAAGTIHHPDQHLEPLIYPGAHTLIIPPGHPSQTWHIQWALNDGKRYFVGVGTYPPKQETKLMFSTYSRVLPSQLHRGLAKTPYDLKSLDKLCRELGFDLLGDLVGWLKEPAQLVDASERWPLLLLSVPKRRINEGADEEFETWCYSLDQTIASLGEILKVTFTVNGVTVVNILGSTEGLDLTPLRTWPWRVITRLDRSAAREFSGISRRKDANLLGIGAGAIGSNVAMVTTRSGLGVWTIVDDDILLPHNTVRQVQKDENVGVKKAEILRHELDSVLAEGGHHAISVDVLRPGTEVDCLKTALSSADVAVDFSASPAVLGWLAQQPIKRAVSAFFGPDGSDLVVLAEDDSREVRIDEIEAQYFWAVAAEDRLKGHLAAARMDRIRYANACQDLSRPLPPWQVYTLCGLAAGCLTRIIDESKASFRVWRLDVDSGAIESISVPLDFVTRFDSASMRVTLSDAVIRTMRALRRQAGRDETGGVLLGSYDLVGNVLHIVAALPAPADSRRSPTYFIRGMKDLKPLIESVAEASAGRLHYVGEWHSHPAGAPARPSDDDEEVYSHLKRHIDPAGSPYVMAICGERETWLRAGWRERGLLEGVVVNV
ncbi:Mov34/MPN/PAD-1 family protein [Pseudomonas oryzihabitans]|uniref:Thiamine biosynthesis protein ThiF n=1 Tax=Pseudomonas oryzihabitans TaxID=47885 RepID=A0A2Z5AAJ0_9PSED|nr:Mov34/MPN/PAD-1 family protein [Pseudomonas oryzihabitans]AXA67835.1 hypothetical protein CE139_19170 [Pseudomonas oryzihabitans]